MQSRLFIVLTSDTTLHLNYASKKKEKEKEKRSSHPDSTKFPLCHGLQMLRVRGVFTEATQPSTMRALRESKTFELELKLKYSVRGSVVTVTRMGTSFVRYRTIREFFQSGHESQLLSVIGPLI